MANDKKGPALPTRKNVTKRSAATSKKSSKPVQDLSNSGGIIAAPVKALPKKKNKPGPKPGSTRVKKPHARKASGGYFPTPDHMLKEAENIGNDESKAQVIDNLPAVSNQFDPLNIPADIKVYIANAISQALSGNSGYQPGVNKEIIAPITVRNISDYRKVVRLFDKQFSDDDIRISVPFSTITYQQVLSGLVGQQIDVQFIRIDVNKGIINFNELSAVYKELNLKGGEFSMPLIFKISDLQYQNGICILDSKDFIMQLNALCCIEFTMPPNAQIEISFYQPVKA